jgi:hypothetical protein
MSEPLSQSDAIARELEAIGEAPLSEDELAMLVGAELEHEPDVEITARLIELSRPYEDTGLSELDARRVWRRIDQRRGAPPAAEQPTITSEGPSRSWSLWIGAALAIAAAAVIVVMLPSDETSAGRPARAPTSPTGPSATEVAAIGEQARSALRALDDGLDDTARAEQMSRDYQRRLEAKR